MGHVSSTCCRRWRLVANWQYADHTLRSLDICSKCSALAPITSNPQVGQIQEAKSMRKCHPYVFYIQAN